MDGSAVPTKHSTPALLSLKELDDANTAAPPDSTASLPSTWFPAHASQLFRTLLLLIFTASSAALASGGVLVLAYLIATHSLTPRQLWYSEPLQLELSGRDLVSRASLLHFASPNTNNNKQPAPPATKALPSNARFLPPGQEMDIWLDLSVPITGKSAWSEGDLAHLTIELESVDGKVAARATQPIVLRSTRASIWRLLLAPLRWIGILGDSQLIQCRVMSNYVERRDVPFAAVALTVKPRADGGVGPNIMAATLRVHLHVGILRRMLYHARPSSLLALALGVSAAAAAVGGSLSLALCLTLLVYSIVQAGSKEGGEGATDFESVSGASDLLAGVSSTGTTPRDVVLDSSGEEEEGGLQREEHAEPSGDGDGVREKKEKELEKLLDKLPGAGRPLPGDDTPFVGSEATAGGTSRQEIGGAGLRQRPPTKNAS